MVLVTAVLAGVVAGICLLLVAALTYFGGLSWFGRLPGDVRYKGTRARVYFPVTSMLLLSLAFSLLVYLLLVYLLGSLI